MLDLSRVAKLHEAALAAGLPGVLADGHHIEKDSISGTFMLINNWGDYVGPVVSQAAVAWWLHDWFLRVSNAGTLDANDILQWAEEIVANRKANP